MLQELEEHLAYRFFTCEWQLREEGTDGCSNWNSLSLKLCFNHILRSIDTPDRCESGSIDLDSEIQITHLEIHPNTQTVTTINSRVKYFSRRAG